MNLLDQWLVRITVSGFLTGFLVLLYWFVQKKRPDLLSGRQKKIIWLILLFSACLVVPWPAAVYLPEPLLQTIQKLRLPDLDQPRLTAEQVNVSVENMNDYINAISQAENKESGQSFTFVLPVDEIPRFIFQPILNLAAHLLSYWRGIYWIGLALTIIGLLLGKLKVEYLRLWGGRYQRKKNRLIVLHAENQYQGGFPDPDAAKNWTRILSRWRDALGYYRHGQVKYQIENPDAPGQIMKNWLGHHLPVPREISETDYPQYWQDKSAVKAPLALALYRLHHPDVGTSLLYCLVRVIYWFFPVWLWLYPLFPKNLLEQRSQALARRLSARSKPDRPILIRESKSVSLAILVCGVLLLSFLLVNMPSHLLPLIDRIEDQAGERYDWQMRESPINGFADAAGSIDPLPAIYGDMSVFLLEVDEYGVPELYLAKTSLDQNGPSIDWWYNINAVIGGRHFSPGQLKLKDYHMIGNRSLMLLFLITDMTDRPETGEAIYLHLDTVTGSLARIRVLDNPLQLAREFCIMDNGDLLVVEWHRTEDRIDSRFFSSLVRPQEHRAIIKRIDQRGQLIWQVDPLDQGVDLARQTWSGFSRVQGIDVIKKEKDGGFYLAINDNWIIHHESSRAADQIFRNSGSLLRFDMEGRLIWQEKISDQRYPFIPDQILISQQGQLYLSGTQIYQDAYFALPSWNTSLQRDTASDSEFQKNLRRMANNYREAHSSGHVMSFSAAGKLLWQKNLAGILSSQINDSLLVDDLLTISLKHWLPTDEQPGLAIQQSLIRLSSDGEVDAWFDLPRVFPGQTEAISVWLDAEMIYLSTEIYNQMREEQTAELPPIQETSFEFR